MRTTVGLLVLGFLFVPSFTFSSGPAEAEAMEAQKIILPDAVGAWRAAGPPQMIDAGNIFDYMDGGGELYLAYRFDHLQAYEYKEQGDNDILVELYHMKGPDDAFGLLSLDWGGEAVDWKRRVPEPQAAVVVPPARALYGMGLLRLWSGDLYARIMAVRETPKAREAILKLGETIVAGRRESPLPTLLRLLPPSLDPHWTLKKERTGYFRSHLVLNSLYYLSHENILALDTSCEAVYATYEEEPALARKRIHLLVIRYPGKDRAGKALERFLAAYLSGRVKGEAATAGRGAKGFFHVEDGWLAFNLNGRLLVLVFECPDLRSARGIVEQVVPGKS